MHPLVTICEGKAAMKTVQTAAHRYHDICMGHRVVGHEGKCRHLHGHNYRIHFYCEGAHPVKPKHASSCVHLWERNIVNRSCVCAKCNLEVDENTLEPIVKEAEQHTQLDSVGRVIDFGVMKEKLCQWLEDNWDHKFMYWTEDPLIGFLYYAPVGKLEFFQSKTIQQSFFSVPFNPTAENIAHHLLTVVAPQQLAGTGVVCTKIVIEETAKCAVTVTL